MFDIFHFFRNCKSLVGKDQCHTQREKLPDFNVFLDVTYIDVRAVKFVPLA